MTELTAPWVETDRPVLLTETGVAPRWYIPSGDVEAAALAGHVAAGEHPGVRIIVDGTPERWP
jgi:hypothetical protein